MAVGGANMTAQLALVHSQRFHKLLPVQAMVFDSAPGQATWQHSVSALMAVFPKQPLVRLLGTLVIHLTGADLDLPRRLPARECYRESTERSQQFGVTSPGGPSMLPLFGSG